MEEKQPLYEQSLRELDSVLEGIHDPVAVMATINCILKINMPNFYWVGFYRVIYDHLLVGPYQGTMGCLRIEFGRGVCGTCAAERKTQIVADVHQFPGHIACDSQTNSEIVVPVVDKSGALIAVFDVDSTELNTFDAVDQTYLEKVMTRFFA